MPRKNSSPAGSPRDKSKPKTKENAKVILGFMDAARGTHVTVSDAQQGAVTAMVHLAKTANVYDDKEQVLKTAENIIVNYIIKHGGVIFGGTAFKLLLPQSEYNKAQITTINDYDVYLPKAREHATALAAKLHKAGLPNVEGNTNLHYGTYKIYVDYQPMVDVHDFPARLFNYLKHEASEVSVAKLIPNASGAKVFVASPDWLRLQIYKEFMKPLDMPSRWSKLASRLTLLNRHFPLSKQSYKKCDGSSCHMDLMTVRHSDHPAQLHVALDLLGQYISDNGLVVFGFTAMAAFVRSHKSYFFDLAQVNSYPLQLIGSSDVGDYDVFTPNLDADVRSIVTLLYDNVPGLCQHKDARRCEPIEPCSCIARLVITKYGLINDIIPRHTEISIRYEPAPGGGRGGHTQSYEEKLIDLYEDRDCVGYVEANAVFQDGLLVLPFRIAALPTLMHMWFTWLFLDKADLLVSSGNDKYVHEPQRRRANQCKIICAIEYLLENQTHLTTDPFAMTSSACAMSEFSPTAAHRELIRKHRENVAARWTWRPPKK